MSRQRTREHCSLEGVFYGQLGIDFLGLRFRGNVRPVRSIRRNVDIVFGPAGKVAVLWTGCFGTRAPSTQHFQKLTGVGGLRSWRETPSVIEILTSSSRMLVGGFSECGSTRIPSSPPGGFSELLDIAVSELTTKVQDRIFVRNSRPLGVTRSPQMAKSSSTRPRSIHRCGCHCLGQD